jgi:radical SAM protein with 4Fe4S-binding SPASM domain
MYYHLKSEYNLRGWKQLPYGIVNRNNGNVAFMNEDGYLAIKLAANGLDKDSLVFTERQRMALEEAAKLGFLEERADVSRLSEEQDYVVYPSIYMRSAQWSITGKCNYKCKHCFMSAPHAKYDELPFETCMEIIRQLAECGIHSISLTGGEPLIRPDFWQIVDELTDKQIIITMIYSNGRLVNRQFLEGLQKRGLSPEINISFDGVGCHDWLRGVKGAEDAAIEAFKLCNKMGFQTGAEYCLYKGNRNKLRETVNLLASLGVKSLKVSPVVECGEWLNSGADMTLTPAQVYETYLSYLPCYYEDGHPLELQLSDLFRSKDADSYSIPGCRGVKESQIDSHCLCGHARSYVYISADGRYLPCMPVSGNEELAKQFPKVQDLSLKEALEQSFYVSCINQKLGAYLEHNPDCNKCEYRLDCASGCRGRAATKEDYMAKDSDICILFTGGYVEQLKAMMGKLNIKQVI